MTRTLVAGSTGYLGGFVCRELKSRGYLARALWPRKTSSVTSISSEEELRRPPNT